MPDPVRKYKKNDNGDPKGEEKRKRMSKALSVFREQYDKDRKSFAKEKYPIDPSIKEDKDKAIVQLKKRSSFVKDEGRIPSGIEYKLTDPNRQTSNQKIVFDKLSNLSDEDLVELRSFSNKVAKEFIGKSMTESIQTLRKIDLSSIKELRKRADLTRDEVLNLIETNKGSSLFDRAMTKSVRAAASFKDFKKGGSIKLIKKK